MSKAQPAQNYNFFHNFVLARFWWIADCSFNDMKHIISKNVFQVDPHIDYTIRFCHQLDPNFFQSRQFWN